MNIAVAGAPLAELRRRLHRLFAENRLDSPGLDARLIVGLALNLSHTELVSQADRRLSLAEAERVHRLAARRLAGEPVARLTGEKEFWGLTLRLSRDVLVPRPESETVVSTALQLITAAGRRAAALRIADLGTGSGALLLALLCELPAALGVGTDLCPRALALAAENASRCGLAGRASFVLSDFGSALTTGGFDLIVSNPPYIASGELAALAREVREHDPALALNGGADGLQAYRQLARDAGRLLRLGGHLVVELGAGGWPAAAQPFAAAGLKVNAPVADLAGIARALPILRSRH